jgi:HTH-type transcriptional regulator/antitoxin HigA
MIFSDRQYSVSKEQSAKLREALERVRVDTTKHERLRTIEAKALESQIAEIAREIADYELLKSGSVAFTESYALADLPRILIQARIAQGLNQSDLAERLGMKPQQIQRYEATEYMSASLARLMEIADVLKVRVSQSFSAVNPASESSLFVWSNASDVDWSRFPLKEMAKRSWLKGPDLVEAARSYFLEAAGPQFATALHRKKVRSGNAPNEYSLLAWQARVLELAQKDQTAGRLGDFELNDMWLSELVSLTRDEHGPRKSRNLLLDHGISLVVERHLPGTYLDGAAMISPRGNPIVALTLRYDRLDNFWFVLFHELGHVFQHLYTSMHLDFFDEEDGTDGDPIEWEADVFALNQLVPNTLWKQCLSRFALTEEAVKIDAEKLGIAPSIIAGRIRKERNNYRIFTDLVGSGAVRSQLMEGQG